MTPRNGRRARMAARPRAMPAGAFPWREDGRCGNATVAPDGSRPAICNPWQPDGLTCCLDTGCARRAAHLAARAQAAAAVAARRHAAPTSARSTARSRRSATRSIRTTTPAAPTSVLGGSADHCGCRGSQYGARVRVPRRRRAVPGPVAGRVLRIRTVVVHPDDTFDEEDDADDISLDERKKILAAHGIPLRDNLGQLNSIKNLGKDRRPQLDPAEDDEGDVPHQEVRQRLLEGGRGARPAAAHRRPRAHRGAAAADAPQRPRPPLRHRRRRLRRHAPAAAAAAARSAGASVAARARGRAAVAAAAGRRHRHRGRHPPAALPKLESIRLADGDTHEDGRVEVRKSTGGAACATSTGTGRRRRWRAASSGTSRR